MQVQDVTSFIRNLGSEPTTGQWKTDLQYAQFVDRAQKIIVRKLLWPESRFYFTSQATVQEYQLQEVLRILRVYVAGQPVVRTDIPTLEGQQWSFNDQTGTSGGPGGAVVPGAAPVLVTNAYTPQWTSQAPATYPVASSLGYPSPSAQPWMAGMRPRYYARGGNLGLVPAPISAYTVVCDVVAQPVTVSQPTDTLVLPDIALDAVAWKAIELAEFSDPDPQAADKRNYALTQFNEAMKDVKKWRREYDGMGPRGPRPLTQRSFYRKGNNRVSSGWGGC